MVERTVFAPLRRTVAPSGRTTAVSVWHIIAPLSVSVFVEPLQLQPSAVSVISELLSADLAEPSSAVYEMLSSPVFELSSYKFSAVLRICAIAGVEAAEAGITSCGSDIINVVMPSAADINLFFIYEPPQNVKNIYYIIPCFGSSFNSFLV